MESQQHNIPIPGQFLLFALEQLHFLCPSREAAKFQAVMRIPGHEIQVQEHSRAGPSESRSIPLPDASVKSGKQQSILILSFPPAPGKPLHSRLGQECQHWSIPNKPGASQGWHIPGLEHPSPGLFQPLSKIQDAAEHPHPQLSPLPGKLSHSRPCQPLRRLPVPGAAFPAHDPAGSVHLARLCKL